jgi:hypothetical protein
MHHVFSDALPPMIFLLQVIETPGYARIVEASGYGVRGYVLNKAANA